MLSYCQPGVTGARAADSLYFRAKDAAADIASREPAAQQPATSPSPGAIDEFIGLRRLRY